MKSCMHRCLILGALILLMSQACVLTNLFQPSEVDPPPALEPSRETVPAPTLIPTQVSTSLPTATETFTPTMVPEPVTWVDVLPIDLGDDQVLLWAGGARASSSADQDAYHAGQALGKPDTLACGRFVTAWQPTPEETQAWIELYFKPNIMPNHLSILQSYLPSQISKVEMITLDEEVITVYDQGVDDVYQPDECPATRGFWLPEVEVLISAVRITLERGADEAWTQIDAVGIEGFIAEGQTEPLETDTWVEEDLGDENGDFYTPRYYSNKNRITALSFADSALWTASDGGVVSWDLNMLNPTSFTEVQGLPGNATRAIAYCDWEYGQIVTGGVGGVALYDGVFFNKLEHLGEDELGPVTALACDPQSELLWVGYLGHLSRYDMDSQRWTEFSESAGMPGDVVRQIKVIGQEVWLATAYGVAVVRGGDQLTAYTPDNSEIPAKFVHAIAPDAAGDLWMATSNGLLAFDGVNWSLWENSEIDGGPLLNMLMGIDEDGSGNLWIADAYGTLCHFDPQQKKCFEVVSPADDAMVLTDFEVDAQGRLALGDDQKGAWFVFGEEWFPLETRDQILDNAINAIAYAPDGNLWVASRAGVQYFPADQPARPWQELDLPENAQANVFFVGPDGLWIGHTGGAVFLPYLDQERLDLSTGDPPKAIANAVTAITADQNGLTYFGTSSGLNMWDETQFYYQDLLTAEERSKNVYPPKVNVLYFDGETVWVGASHGLFAFKDGRLETSWRETLDELSPYNTSVGIISQSPDGTGLLVAVSRFLYLFKGGEFEEVLELPSEIRCAYTMPTALLLGTASTGLYTLPIDQSGIYWDLVSGMGQPTERFGTQAITMSDMHTLWIASAVGGLQRSQALYTQ